MNEVQNKVHELFERYIDGVEFVGKLVNKPLCPYCGCKMDYPHYGFSFECQNCGSRGPADANRRNAYTKTVQRWIPPERRGRWIKQGAKARCSECGAANKDWEPPCCPVCGAKMDKEEENAQE